MSKTWYPIINYEKCVDCGVCTNKCTHGVYDQNKAPTPVVINPESCIHGCHGCGNLCPNEAISYVGETTVIDKSCECGCSCGDDSGGCC